jgi:hypothetical protein
VAAVIAALLIGWSTYYGVIPNGKRPQRTGQVGKLAAAQPFTVTSNVRQSICLGAGGWVVPRRPGQFSGPPTDENNWDAWAARVGGVPANRSYVTFSVQGKSAADVTLTDLRVTVLKRRHALAGTEVAEGCGGLGAYRWVAVDLDASPPRRTTGFLGEFASQMPTPERRPITFPYHVSLTDAESFEVFGNAERCDCLWRIELFWSSQGRTGSYVIDDRGGPIHTTGSVNAKERCAQGTTLFCRHK